MIEKVSILKSKGIKYSSGNRSVMADNPKPTFEEIKTLAKKFGDAEYTVGRAFLTHGCTVELITEAIQYRDELLEAIRAYGCNHD